jgi:hypothetical protein
VINGSSRFSSFAWIGTPVGQEGYITGISLIKYPGTLKDREKVNPSNIMLLDDDMPIIVDLDSYCRIGQDLKSVGRTYEWSYATLPVRIDKSTISPANFDCIAVQGSMERHVRRAEQEPRHR